VKSEPLNIQGYEDKRILIINYLCRGIEIMASTMMLGGGEAPTYNSFILEPNITDRKNLELFPRKIWRQIEFGQGCIDSLREQLKKDYVTLLKQMDDLISCSDIIYIVSHDYLASYPFHVLINKEERYLIEDKVVCYSPSARMILDLLSEPVDIPSSDLCLVSGYSGDPSATEECNGIRGLLNGNGKKAKDDKSVAEVLNEIKQSNQEWLAVHLVAHGFPKSGARAMESKFKLAEGQEVEAMEWLLGGPRAAFCSLTICSLQPSMRAGDMFGFPLAILGRGTPSCLMAYCPVIKKSSIQLSREIYKGIFQDKKSRAEAVTDAIRGMIDGPVTGGGNNQDFSHPANWAPFFFIGDFRKIYPES